MTDIGPSMSGVISSPTYIGATPSGFRFTAITLDDAPYPAAESSYEIDPETGMISITQTGDLPVGWYRLSVSCMSGRQLYEFADIVEVQMMAPVPEGITVEPEMLQVEYADVLDTTGEVLLPTAQVTTQGTHVSIRKYEIARSDYSHFFAISSTGEISVVQGNTVIQPGVYVLSLKLTTGASGEDEGIFENVLRVNITSRPLELNYTPATGKIEEETELSGATTFVSNPPVLKGSLEGLTYRMLSVEPATDKIHIDAQTGVLSVASGHGMKAGEKYLIDVHVANAFSAEGVNFEGVFQLEAVEFIEPIMGFAYEDREEIQATAFEIRPSDEMKGDEVRFEFVELDSRLQGQLTIDHAGVIRAVKGNSIPLGNYTVRVEATNPKTDPQAPTVAVFGLNILENPNYFTYVRYGNNLELTPLENYADQFRIPVGGKLADVKPVPVATDAKVELYYELTAVHQTGGTKIDPATGEITLSTLKAPQCGIVMVTATAGKGTAAEVSVDTPVFFHFSSEVAAQGSTGESVSVEYTPFVLKVNPNTGARSAIPVIRGVNNPVNFTLDYRRNFNYYNFQGSHKDGQPSVEDSFLQYLWDQYKEALPNSGVNYSSRHPLSYYANTDKGTNTLEVALGYVDARDYSVVVNPNKWIQNGDPANGAMIGQMTFMTNGTDPASGGQTFPLVMWFDTKFK